MQPIFSRSEKRHYSSLATKRGFDGLDVDLLHGHHRIESSFGGCTVGRGGCLGQDYGRDLPVNPPPVFAPSALALFAAIPYDCIPVAICFSLINCRDLK